MDSKSSLATVKISLIILYILIAVGMGYLLTTWAEGSRYIAQFGLAQYLFGALALAVGIGLLAIGLVRGPQAILTPLGAILIGFEMFILMGPLLLPQWATDLYSDPIRISRAWAAASIGLLSFVIGYYGSRNIGRSFSDGGRTAFFYRHLQVSRLFWVSVLLLIVRLIFYRIWYSSSGASSGFLLAGSFATVLEGGRWFWGWWFANIAAFACVVTLTRVVFGSESCPAYYRLLGIALILVSLYLSWVEGNRGRFMMPVTAVGYVSVALMNRNSSEVMGRISSRLSAILVIAVLILGTVWQTYFRGQSLDVALENLSTRGFQLSVPELAERGGDMLIYLDRILNEFGSVEPFWLGKSYLAPLVVLIPRDIWPDKPVGVAAYLDNAGPTLVGEWYANYGWFGILVGMGLLGILLQRGYQFYLKHSQSDLALMIYAITLGTLVYQVRGDFNTVTSYWLYSALLILLIWWGSSTPVAQTQTRSKSDG